MEIRFDTSEVHHSHKVDYVRTAMRRVLSADCAIEPHPARQDDARFDCTMHGMQVGEDVQLLALSGSPYRSDRPGPGRADWQSILVQLDGWATVRGARASAQLTPGDICLIPPDEPLVVDRTTNFRQVIMDVRAHLLHEMLPGWRQILARRIAADQAGARAIAQLVRFTTEQRAALDAACRDHLSATLLRLLPSLAGASESATGGAWRRGSRLAAYHRERVEEYVTENLGSSELSVDSIAGALGLSRRYVHKLFDGDGPTLMQWVMERRLQAARSELQQRHGRSITEVAYACGFNSLSHFSRAYKQRFGTSPSQP